MESPLGPRPVTGGLRPHRVLRPSRDRKGNSRPFHDELPDEHEGPPGPPKPPPPPAEPRGTRRPHADDEPGHLLDLEA